MILTLKLDIFVSGENVEFFSFPSQKQQEYGISINPLDWKDSLKTDSSSDKTEPRPAFCKARWSLSFTNIQ